jgi:hypothetical protein
VVKIANVGNRGRYAQFDNTDPDDVITSSNCTPIHSSGTYPIYVRAANELINKLKHSHQPEAKMMVASLKHYTGIFYAWSPTNKPTDKERTRLVDEFLELCGAVNKFVAVHGVVEPEEEDQLLPIFPDELEPIPLVQKRD